MTPVKKIEFLGLTVDSLNLSLSLPEEKVQKIMNQCQELYNSSTPIPILELTQLIGLLSSTVQTVLPAQLQFHYLQQQQIHSQKLKARIDLVDIKPGVVQWLLYCTTTGSGTNANRCLKEGLGSSVSRNLRWSLVQRGAEYAHKHTRTTYSEVSHSDFHQAESDKINTLSNRQHHCFDLLTKNGGNSQQDNVRSEQGYMEVPVGQWDHNYCRIPPKLPECDSRLAIKKHQGLLRMETLSNNISTDLSEVGTTRNRSVCLTVVPPNPKVCSMETRPSQLEDRCNATRLVSEISVCIPPPPFLS